MTIETPLANRPLNRPMMFGPTSPFFHDYASSPSHPDHSLAMDVRYTSSPNSVTMYDGEFLPSSLGSVCSEASFVDTGQAEDFDLKPQYECPSDAFMSLNVEVHDLTVCDDLNSGVRGDAVWSPNDSGAMKMEDVFQVDQQDAIQGPTLAALNFDDSVYDDIESIIQKEEQERKMASGGSTVWQQAHQAVIDMNFNVPQVVTGGQKPPISFTTCTITSTTSSAMDVTLGSAKASASSATPSIFTPKPFPEALRIKTEPLENQMNSNCLQMAQESSFKLPVPLTSPVPIPSRKSNALGSMSFSLDCDVGKTSSLQRLLTDSVSRTPVKREPLACLSYSFPSAKPSVLHKTFKRSHSPIGDDGDLVRSMEQKWEEIKQFIHDEEQSSAEKAAGNQLRLQTLDLSPQHKKQHVLQELQPVQHRTPLQPLSISVPPTVAEPITSPKRIKVEPKDPSFSPRDDIESGDEEQDSDEDSDDGDSVAAREGELSDIDEDDDDFSVLEESGAAASKGPPRYFWMYNTQSKGPKGKRLCKAVNAVDPYTLADFEDPVFDPELNQTQYKHNGKARRGDGNDITPSPAKLYSLGNELKKLNRTINDLTPVSELPAGARSKSRKEKNKLASRACRLKKKAQHEANKVKLYGLEREHHDLLLVLDSIRKDVFKTVADPASSDELLVPRLERLMKTHLKHMIAGHTADYVNSILAKVVSGDPTGGLNT